MQKDDGGSDGEKQRRYFKTVVLVLLVGAVSIVHQVNLVLVSPTESIQIRRSFEAEPSNGRLSMPGDPGFDSNAPTADFSTLNIPNNSSLPKHGHSSDNEHCQRKCHPEDKHYNIIILDHYEQAGLGDRLYVFRRLAILAGYLCAKLYVPPPYTMLATFHNGGQKLPENLTWSEMEDIRFLDDNSAALVSYDLDPVDEYHGFDQAFHLNEYFKDPKYSSWLRLRFNDRADYNKVGRVFRNQVRKLDEFVEHQQPHDKPLKTGFIWEVYPVLYHYYDAYNKWSLESIGDKEAARLCQYTESRKSTTSHQVKDRVLEFLQQEYAHSTYFVPLHIRRGDTTDVCNTSLAKMNDFLSCSFDRFPTTLGKITVLLATDERDTCYRQAIRSMIESLGHTSVDLDAVVWDVLRDFAGTRNSHLLNNMFVYKVISDIRDDERIGTVLEKRRDQCPECQSLVSLLHPPETGTKPMPADETRQADFSGKIDLPAILKAYDLCGKETKSHSGT